MYFFIYIHTYAFDKNNEKYSIFIILIYFHIAINHSIKNYLKINV